MFAKLARIFQKKLEEQNHGEFLNEDACGSEIQSAYGVLFYSTEEGLVKVVEMILKIMEHMRDANVKTILKYMSSGKPQDDNYVIFEKILNFLIQRFCDDDKESLLKFISQQLKDVVMLTIINSKSDDTFSNTVNLFKEITDRNIITDIYAFKDRNRKYNFFKNIENCSRLEKIWLVLQQSRFFTSEELVNYVLSDDFSAFHVFAYEKNKINYDLLYSKVMELLGNDQKIIKEKLEKVNLKFSNRSLDLQEDIPYPKDILWKKISDPINITLCQMYSGVNI